MYIYTINPFAPFGGKLNESFYLEIKYFTLIVSCNIEYYCNKIK